VATSLCHTDGPGPVEDELESEELLTGRTRLGNFKLRRIAMALAVMKARDLRSNINRQ
jgi:hypothetical protein